MQVSPCRAPAQSVKKEGSPTIEAGTGHAFKEELGGAGPQTLTRTLAEPLEPL